MRKHRTVFFGILILCLVIPCVLLIARSSFQEDREWTDRFGFAIGEFEPVDFKPSVGLTEKIGKRVGKAIDLSTVRVYECQSREFGKLRVATIQVDAFNDAMLGIALSKGVVLGVAGWNHELIEKDSDGAWDRFFRQFKERQVVNLADEDTEFDSDEYWEQIEADESEEGDLLRALYEHRTLMLDNSYLVKRITIDIEEREVVPDADWLASYIPRFERMIELAKEIEPVIGDAAVEKYQRLARKGIATLETAIDASRKGNLSDVKAATIQRGSICAECHSRRNRAWDKLKEGEFGVRNDLYQVPIDVWSLPDDKELSQTIANHLHALLIAIGTSK